MGLEEGLTVSGGRDHLGGEVILIVEGDIHAEAEEVDRLDGMVSRKMNDLLLLGHQVVLAEIVNAGNNCITRKRQGKELYFFLLLSVYPISGFSSLFRYYFHVF